GMQDASASIGTENRGGRPSRPRRRHRPHDLPPRPSARAARLRHQRAASAEAPRRWATVEPPPRALRSKARRRAAPLAGCSRATARLPEPRRQPPAVPPRDEARARERRSPALPPSVAGKLLEAGEHRPRPWALGGRPWWKRRAPPPPALRPDGSQVEGQCASAPPRRGGRALPPPLQGR